jgi:hypothetical protein
MIMGKHAAKLVRFIIIWGIYLCLVAVFLHYLQITDFWRTGGEVAKSLKKSPQEMSSETSGKRIPNLWERPTTMTFKIDNDTKIEVANGGTQRYDRYGNLWKESDPPLRVKAEIDDLLPGEVVVIIIDDYATLVAKEIYIEHLVGFHAGEEPRPEYTKGGPGWANNITFSGWTVSTTRSSITVRYP